MTRTNDGDDVRTVLLTGARGNTGRLVGPRLAARPGVAVRGGSRDPSGVRLPGVTPVRFDWRDGRSWASALDGVDAIYLARPELQDAPELAAALLDAAPAHAHVVLLSDNVHGDEAPASSWEGRVERAVTSRAASWTLLRPSWFQQIFDEPRYLLGAIRDEGVLDIPTGGSAISFVDARDIADVAVRALLEPGHDGRAHTLTGPDASTLAEVAEQLTAVSGHAVRHLDRPLREAVAAFADGPGADPWYVGYIDHVWAIMRSGSAARVSDDVARVLGAPARPLTAYIAEHAAAWRR